MAVDDLKDVTKARKVLIEMRRNWIQAIAAGYQRGKTEDAIKGLIDVQQAIDVTDHAIEELAEEDDDEEEDDE